MRLSWKEHKLTTRFLILFGLLIMLFSAAGVVWYHAMQHAAERIAADFGRRLVSQINNRIHVYFENLDREYIPLITDPIVSEFLNAGSMPRDSYELFVLNRRFNFEVLPPFLYSGTNVRSMFVLSREQGMLLSRTEAGEYEIDAKETFETADRIAGPYWAEVHAYANPIRSVIRFYRKIYSNGYQLKGILVADIPIREIERLIESPFDRHDQNVWIVNTSDKRVIYHTDSALIGLTAPETTREIWMSPGSMVVSEPDGPATMLLSEPSSIPEWTVMIGIPYGGLTRDLDDLWTHTIWTAAAMFFLILWAGMGFSWTLTKSLMRLRRMMIRTEAGGLNANYYRHHPSTIVEINSLFDNFKSMVSRIHELMEEVKEAERKERRLQLQQSDIRLKLLHSQINPHFLYNSLEVINSYAIMENSEPISRMAQALAKVFRYSVKGEQKVMLLEEIGHIESYLLIQQERYRETIQVEIKVDRDVIANVPAIRIMLQPIVENAFKHGYENYDMHPGYIGIIGEQRDGMYCLSVVDKGKGMAPSLRDRLTERFARSGALADDETGTDGEREQLGMENVHVRIRNVYGTPYGISIEQSDETGTIVEFHLPSGKKTKKNA